ncbi:MAG TPA: serine hydrolase domain-containing protein [Chloroflexota bacterium]|nr:serine hydrolase domain-containing protein [Chloroflexota bacterium]
MGGRWTLDQLAKRVEAVVQQGIADGCMPGAVVLVWHDGQVLVHAAYGHAVLWQDGAMRLAEPVPATGLTVYDCASLSKLFTATCVMRLVERGQVELDVPVNFYLPEFGANNKLAITVRHLLAHVSGLHSGLQLWRMDLSREARLQRVLADAPDHPPATFFRYSDLNAIALGVLAERVDGRPLDRQVAEDITGPLCMADTGYNPPAEQQERVAATEYQPHEAGRDMVRGTVHDENAWSLGGVAGHAGIFSTATDLLRFSRCHLDLGSLDGAQVLRPETAEAMQTLQTGYLASGATRGLGWELAKQYYMGKLSSPTTFGHTGFTGTSLVIARARRTIVVLLANRVHPTRSGPPFNPVREAVADAVAAAVGVAAP